MKPAGGILANLLSLLIFVIGVVVSFYEWSVGLAVILVSLAVVCLSRYRVASTGFAGSLAITTALIVLIYAYGAVDREASVFNINVSPTVWVIIFVGAISLMTGLLLAGGSRYPAAVIEDLQFTESGVFFWIGLGALFVGAANYATGDIPLLSGDVNATRLVGNVGLLGRLWPLILPISQVSVIIFLLTLLLRRRETRWTVLGLFSAVILVLGGGRSFLAVALISSAIIYIEIRRPKIVAIMLVIVSGLFAFGIVGNLRALASSSANIYTKYMTKQGFDSWHGSTDLSLQTGPRVLTLAIERLNGESLNGRLLIGDIGNFLNSTVPRSDRLVTELVGRDPSGGGFPPTIFGSFYLDFGLIGLVVGAVITGFTLAVSRRKFYRTPNLSTLIWFSYFASYTAISAYSYVSIRPSWLVVLLICILAQALRRDSNGPDSACLEIPEFPGRGRASYSRPDERLSRTRPHGQVI